MTKDNNQSKQDQRGENITSNNLTSTEKTDTQLQQTQKKIRLGIIILAVSLSTSVGLGIFASITAQKLEKANQELTTLKDEIRELKTKETEPSPQNQEIKSVVKEVDAEKREEIIKEITQRKEELELCDLPDSQNGIGVIEFLGQREKYYLVSSYCGGGSGGINYSVLIVDASQTPFQIKIEPRYFLGKISLDPLTSIFTHNSWIGACGVGGEWYTNYYWDGKELNWVSTKQSQGSCN